MAQEQQTNPKEEQQVPVVFEIFDLYHLGHLHKYQFKDI